MRVAFRQLKVRSICPSVTADSLAELHLVHFKSLASSVGATDRPSIFPQVQRGDVPSQPGLRQAHLGHAVKRMSNLRHPRHSPAIREVTFRKRRTAAAGGLPWRRPPSESPTRRDNQSMAQISLLSLDQRSRNGRLIHLYSSCITDILFASILFTCRRASLSDFSAR